jgi:hypothetical protein
MAKRNRKKGPAGARPERSDTADPRDVRVAIEIVALMEIIQIILVREGPIDVDDILGMESSVLKNTEKLVEVMGLSAAAVPYVDSAYIAERVREQITARAILLPLQEAAVAHNRHDHSVLLNTFRALAEDWKTASDSRKEHLVRAAEAHLIDATGKELIHDPRTTWDRVYTAAKTTRIMRAKWEAGYGLLPGTFQTRLTRERRDRLALVFAIRSVDMAELEERLKRQRAEKHRELTKIDQQPPAGESDGITYRIPANYWPWAVLRQFLATTKECKDDDERFVSSGSNFYLLGEQFLHELADTDLLVEDLRVLDEAPLPHPAFLWLLPNNFMAVRHEDGTLLSVGALVVTLLAIGSGQGVGVDLFNYDSVLKRFHSITLIYKFDDQGVLRPHVSASDGPVPVALREGVLSLLLKVLVSMSAAPKIVECEVTESVRAPKKGKRGLEFRTPRVIGWKIRYIRTGGSANKRQLEKGHVEPHWRRRHIKRVPYGPMSVPLEERPRRIAVVERTRVNSEYEKTK